MAAVDVVHLWKDWGLHALVLLSFTLQLTLLLLAELRRRIDSGVLKAFIWSAYMLADSIAIYTIGHLSATSQAAEHEAMALWAPLLLVHLGGQDNITAYAMEDNWLWLRHLQTLAVQAAGAGYVLYVSLQEPAGDGRRRPLLRRAAILLFVVGVAKYGERVLALMRANSSPSGKSYKIADRNSVTVHGTSQLTETDTEGLLQVAHGMLNVAKDLIKAPLPFVFVFLKYKEEFRGDVLCRVAEMQLSLMHDVLYSKAEVIHTWYGLCIRVFSWVATADALFLFHLHLAVGSSSTSSSISRKDAIVTYVLLAGAVVLETVSGLRIMLSTWTWHFLTSSILCCCCRIGDAFAALRRSIHVADYLPRTWSGSIGQHNLFQMCSSTAARPIVGKVAKWMRVEDWWNTFAYSHSARVSPRIKTLLVEQVLESVKIPEDSPSHIRNSRGRGALERWASAHRDEGPSSRAAAAVPAWKAWLFPKTQDDDELRGYWGLNKEFMLESVLGLEFVESILVWHVATDAYLCWYRRRQGRKEEDSDLARAVLELSNYMLFLLAARPYMLPPPASRTGYATACSFLIESAARSSYIASAEDLIRAHALEHDPDTTRDRDRYEQLRDGVYFNDSLSKGSHICWCLIDKESQAAPGMMLELIAQVWLEMLCYAGAHCSAHSHAMQLSNGSELVTLAALLVRYCERGTMLPPGNSTSGTV